MKLVQTTLCCIVNPALSQVLMIKHNRGIGEGKYNFPGGKLLPGETFLDCAIRETVEETGITPVEPKFVGQINFHTVDEQRHLQNHVFYTEQFNGTLAKDAEECLALWVDTAQIPYSKMRPSDAIWIPRLLAKKPVNLEITFQTSDDPAPIIREVSLASTF